MCAFVQVLAAAESAAEIENQAWERHFWKFGERAQFESVLVLADGCAAGIEGY